MLKKKKSAQIKSDADFHRLQVAFGSSAVHVTPPPTPPFPHPPRGVTARLLCFQCERRRHTVSFLSLLTGTSRTARRFLQIPAYWQGRCELMPKESRAQSRRRALSAAWARRLKESHSFSPSTSTDFKVCARQVDGRRSDRASFSRETHPPLPPTL